MKLAFRAFLAEWSKAPDLRPGIVKMRGFKPHRMQNNYFHTAKTILTIKNSTEIAKQIFGLIV